MSLKVMLKDYAKNQNVQEIEFDGYIIQHYKKLNCINIIAPKGINVSKFIEIKNRFKKVDNKTLIFVNW